MYQIAVYPMSEVIARALGFLSLTIFLLLFGPLPSAYAENPTRPQLHALEPVGVGSPAPVSLLSGPGTTVSTSFGTSYQVNVNAIGQNMVGDAANEPSICIDPINPNRMAIGWRQFNSTNSDFRQAGWGFSSNGGVNWTYGGVLETNVFRSDPVLASDADGRFYYLSLKPDIAFENDLWRSTNGGMTWQRIGSALGGDKAWFTIDATASTGRGNIYQAWSTAGNTWSNRTFSFSRDGGLNWANPLELPEIPVWGVLDVGSNGELYQFGWGGGQFWLNRSTNATNQAGAISFGLTSTVNLAGSLLFGEGPNPGGLLGQAYVAVDRSTNATRGNVYVLCSTGGFTNNCDVMFARSTNGGTTWSGPRRINTDVGASAWHWFGTMSVAPNGRIDVCWYDTRSNPNNNFSELYHCYSLDGGLSWATNRAVSPPFNHSLGYPMQQKIGDYIGMISFDDSACIAYSATFNGEEDIYFLRLDLDVPIALSISRTGAAALGLSWNSVLGRTYCVQHKDSLSAPWPIGTNQVCVVATNTVMTLTDPILPGAPQRFYRVQKQP